MVCCIRVDDPLINTVPWPMARLKAWAVGNNIELLVGESGGQGDGKPLKNRRTMNT